MSVPYEELESPTVDEEGSCDFDPAPILLRPMNDAITEGPTVKHRYESQHARLIGITLVVAGFLTPIFNIALATTIPNPVYWVYHGIWIGIIYILTGVITLVAAKRRTSAMIVGSLFMSCMSCCGTAVLLGLCSAAIHGHMSNVRHFRTTYKNIMIGHALDSLMIICGICGLICAVWGAVTACRAYVCCLPPQPTSKNMGALKQPVILTVIPDESTPGKATFPITQLK